MKNRNALTKYTDEQLRTLLRYKKRIVGTCKVCKGSGFIAESGEDCSCMQLFRWVESLYLAKIPGQYWTLQLKELKAPIAARRLVGEYVQHLDNALEKGLGLLFLGPSGVGKTAMMCEVGKYFLKAGAQVRYTTAHALSKFRTDAELSEQEDLMEADVFLMDELDKVYMKAGSDWVAKNLLNIMKERIDKVWIIATNLEESELETMFGTAMVSMLQRQLKFVPVEGADISKDMQASWLDRLTEESTMTLDHPVMRADAKASHEARRERIKKEYDIVW